MDKIYSKTPDIVFRKIGGEMILVPIKNHVRDLESIYTLNETAARVWELMDGKMMVKEIEDNILNEFDASPEEAQRDILKLVEELESIGCIKGA